MKRQLRCVSFIRNRTFVLLVLMSFITQLLCSVLMSSTISAQSVTGSNQIAQAVFINSTSTTTPNTPIELSIQLKNEGNTLQPTSSPNVKFSLTSSSATGLFAHSADSASWAATPKYNLEKNVSSKSFHYKNTTPGTHTITAKLNGGNIKNEIIVTTTVVVSRFVPSQVVQPTALTLAQRIAAASPGDTVDVTSDETVTGNITIDRELTLTSSNGSTIFTSGQGDLFHVTAPDVVISNLKFTKNDNLDQRIINVSAGNATISGNIFKGRYVRDMPEATRALEISAGAGHVIIGNTITDFYEAAYGLGGSSGQITNNYIANTHGWLLRADTVFDFSGNTFGENNPDIAVVAGSSNNYTCEILRSVFLNNNRPKIINQMLDITSCDMTEPVVPPDPPEEQPIVEPKEEAAVVVTPVTIDDVAQAQQELSAQMARLSEPFVLPSSFVTVESPIVSTAIDGIDVLGAQTTKNPSADQNAKIVAVAATESGWKLFGVLWYWWLLILTILGYAIYRLMTGRPAAQDV